MSDASTEIARKPGAGPAAGAGRTLTPRSTASRETYHPLLELTLTRIREFLREKEAVFWVFVFPVLLAFALGIAFRNTAPERIPVAVAGDGPRVAAMVEALGRSELVQPIAMSPDEAGVALRTGRVGLMVRPAPGQAEAPAAGVGTSFDYRFDPTRPESVTARLAVNDALERAAGRTDVVEATEQTVVEPGARYIDFLIPGLIGMNLMGSGLWGLGFTVVNARTRKVLKRLAATPMRRSHFLLSFMLSRLIFLALEVVAVLGFAWLAFGVTVQGSLFDLFAVALIGALSFAGLGLLIAARPQTIEGVSGLMNLVMLPMWLLSGTFFSAERFPDALQPFIKALPLTALNDSLRSVMNEGAPLAASWPEVLILVVWGVVSFVLALRLFRWQ
jgi:ABC-type multidrug transport system permease subunit